MKAWTEKQQLRFWSRVKRGAQRDCWPWQASTGRNGYGCLAVNGQRWRAHRAAWYLCVGEIPVGLHVLHSCDNPPCCNPLHLFLGTHQHNMADAIAKGRFDHYVKTHCAHGHPYTQENSYTRTRARGGRDCRICRRRRKTQWQARREALESLNITATEGEG